MPCQPACPVSADTWAPSAVPDVYRYADLHLPLLPGTDIWLYNAMLHVLLWEGHADDTFIAAH
ncbi:hypothetical protein ABTG54_22480, partial [Acinetobacter baumannii]